MFMYVLVAGVYHMWGYMEADEVEPLDLGQPIHDLADLGAEHLVDFGASGVGILDGVMQKRDGDARVIKLELGQDGGDFERMGEIGVAGGALLGAVLLHGIDVSPVEQRLVGVRVIGLDPLDELVLTHHLLAALLAAATLPDCRANKKGVWQYPTPFEI